MKKIALFPLGLLSVAVSHAQLNKGRVFLGGSVSTSNVETTVYGTPNSVGKQTTLVVDPSIGVFVKENLVVGVNVGLYKVKAEANGVTQQEQRSIASGIFVRRYFPLGKSFYFYGHGGLNYLNQKTEVFNGTATSTIATANGASLSVYPGIAYGIRKNFLVEVSLRNLLNASYVSGELKNNAGNNESKTNSFNLGINGGGGIPLSIGFNILLGK